MVDGNNWMSVSGTTVFTALQSAPFRWILTPNSVVKNEESPENRSKNEQGSGPL
jgi:hypothetical protein